MPKRTPFGFDLCLNKDSALIAYKLTQHSTIFDDMKPPLRKNKTEKQFPE